LSAPALVALVPFDPLDPFDPLPLGLGRGRLVPELAVPFRPAGRLAPLPVRLPLAGAAFSVARASIGALAVTVLRGFPLEPLGLVPFFWPPLPGPPADAFDRGMARSVRSADGPVGAPGFSSRVGAGGGPPTMPFRNRISWVRIRILLEMIK
jgi:hypothetical protein